jgi:hypothetical protein
MEKNNTPKATEQMRRQRSDSVLGNRMDANLNYRRLRPAGPGSRWHKL